MQPLFQTPPQGKQPQKKPAAALHHIPLIVKKTPPNPKRKKDFDTIDYVSAPTWELLRVYPIWRPRPLCKSGSVSPFTSIAYEKKGINGIEILVAGLFWDGASALLRAVTPSCNISYLSAQENLSLSLCEPNLVENSVKISPPGFFVSLLLFCLISKAAKFPIQTLSFIIYNVSFLFSFSCFLLERYDWFNPVTMPRSQGRTR